MECQNDIGCDNENYVPRLFTVVKIPNNFVSEMFSFLLPYSSVLLFKDLKLAFTSNLQMTIFAELGTNSLI